MRDYCTNYKGNDESIRLDVDKVPYYVICKEKRHKGVTCFLTFFARRCDNDKDLGICTVEITQEDENKEAELCLIKLEEGRYENCGIASTLLNVAENYVYQELKIKEMKMFFAPMGGCYEQATKLYKDYTPKYKNAPNLLHKKLTKQTVKIMNDISTIETIINDTASRDNIEAVR